MLPANWKAHIEYDNATLLRLITDSFSFEEIKTLAFEMGYDHEAIPAPDKIAFAREFILAVKRRNRESDLIQLAKRYRPQVNWVSANRVVVDQWG
jgi:hypothetical protein